MSLIALGGVSAAGAQAPATAPSAASRPAPAAPGTPGGPRLGNLAARDSHFASVAASAGLLEVDAGRMALDRSRNAQVRAFAQRMVEEHGAANEELRSTAKAAGMGEVPAAMVGRHTAALDRLRALNGPEFDREYVAQVGIAAHVEATALFDKAAHAVINPALKAFAAKLLPALRDHLRAAQALARGTGVSLERMKEVNAPVDIDLDSPTGMRDTPALGDAPGRRPGAGSTARPASGATSAGPGAGTAPRQGRSGEGG